MFGGKALTPDAFAQMDALTERIFREPEVQERLVSGYQAITPALLVGAALSAVMTDNTGTSNQFLDCFPVAGTRR